MYICRYEIKTSAMILENFAFVAKEVTDEVAKILYSVWDWIIYLFKVNKLQNPCQHWNVC